jgi:hypothetical protein
MTTTIPAAPPTLEKRIADAEIGLQDAELALGVVVLDGGDEKAAGKRVTETREKLERLRLAVAEESKRAEEAEAQARQREEAFTRWAYLSWWAERFERLTPVFKLRAELRKAEERAMEQPDLHPWLALDNGWVVGEAEAGRLEFINLPEVTTVNVRPAHRINAYCQGEATRVEDCTLTPEELAAWAKKLPPLVAQAAKPLGKDAKPDRLPWA